MAKSRKSKYLNKLIQIKCPNKSPITFNKSCKLSRNRKSIKCNRKAIPFMIKKGCKILAKPKRSRKRSRKRSHKCKCRASCKCRSRKCKCRPTCKCGGKSKRSHKSKRSRRSHRYRMHGDDDGDFHFTQADMESMDRHDGDFHFTVADMREIEGGAKDDGDFHFTLDDVRSHSRHNRQLSAHLDKQEAEAFDLIKRKKYKQADTLMQSILQKDGRRLNTLMAIAILRYEHAGRENDALQYLQNILRYDRNNIKALVLSSWLLFKSGDHAKRMEGQNRITHVLNIDPRGYKIFIDLAISQKLCDTGAMIIMLEYLESIQQSHSRRESIHNIIIRLQNKLESNTYRNHDSEASASDSDWSIEGESPRGCDY